MNTDRNYYAIKYLSMMVNGHLGVKEILRMPSRAKGIDMAVLTYHADIIEEIAGDCTCIYVWYGKDLGGLLEIMLPGPVDMTDLRLVCPYEKQDLPQGDDFTEEALRKLCITNLMNFVWRLR